MCWHVLTGFPKGARENTQHPAPGYRNYTSGAPGGVGNLGYSWSSAVSGSNGVCLGFGVTYLNPSYADYRTHGFQLRCLSE